MAKEKKERKKEKKDKKERKSKKRKQEDLEEVAGSIDSPTNSVVESKTKKPKLLKGLLEKVSGQAEDDFNKKILLKGAQDLVEFQNILSKELIEALKNRGIVSLFEIQVKTLPTILEGKDVIGRARTGMGKTLAFALPVLQQLLKNDTQNGRSPRVIVLAPTRELAKQVAKEFQETSKRYKTLTVYGGASINDQAYALRNGIDIVVGTPGRVIDHIERGNLRLSDIQHFILDEADQMLDMGFKEDMDKVFNFIADQNGGKKFQVLLFSATLPSWVHSVAKEKMDSPETIDLVGDFESASKDVEHLCIQCHWQVDKRASLVSDLVKMYAGSKLGRAIVFCSKKALCNELAVHKTLAKLSKVIHGDITQAQRESTLQGFRNGMFKILIATDVAARGLDIKNVDLVVNFEPPCLNSKPGAYSVPRADVDTYVHRSGRTGRAGKKGVCVTLFSQKQEGVIQVIEKTTSNKLQRIGAPQTADLLLGAARSNIEDMLHIPDSVLDKFGAIADEMMEFYSAKKSISMLLAKVTGFEEAKSVAKRSLLASEVGYVTCKYENRYKNPGEIRLGYIWTVLRGLFRNNPQYVDDVKSMQLLKNEIGAAFDLPEEAVKLLEKKIELGDRTADGFEVCSSLPEVKQRDFSGGYRSGREGRGYGGRGRGRGRGRGFGRNHGGFGGRGRGRGYYGGYRR